MSTTTETLSSKSMSPTSVQKCAAPTSNVEEGRGVEIKTVRNHQYVCSKKLKLEDQLTLIQMNKH